MLHMLATVLVNKRPYLNIVGVLFSIFNDISQEPCTVPILGSFVLILMHFFMLNPNMAMTISISKSLWKFYNLNLSSTLHMYEERAKKIEESIALVQGWRWRAWDSKKHTAYYSVNLFLGYSIKTYNNVFMVTASFAFTIHATLWL